MVSPHSQHSIPTEEILRRRRSLDRLLRSNGVSSQKEFAEEHDVTARTINSDLQWLETHAGEIQKCRRKRFYKDPHCPSPFALTESQTIALLLGHTALCQYGGSVFENEARELLKGVLHTILDPDLRKRISEISKAIKFSSQHSVINIERSLVHDIFTAYLDQKKIKITYCKPNTSAETRTVHPYTFLNESGEWSLVAYCELRSQIQRFKMHRIQTVQLLNQYYTISPKYDSTDFLCDGFDNWRDGKSFQFEIEFDKKTSPHIDSHLHHVTQELTPLENGGTLLKFESEGLPAVARWVMTFGSGAIVHQPPELIQSIQKEIAAMQKNYRNRKG